MKNKNARRQESGPLRVNLTIPASGPASVCVRGGRSEDKAFVLRIAAEAMTHTAALQRVIKGRSCPEPPPEAA